MANLWHLRQHRQRRPAERARIHRTQRPKPPPATVAALGLLLVGLLAVVGGCAPTGSATSSAPPVDATPGIGDAARGKALFTSKVCIGCHQVSGEVRGGTTGPDLRGFASRPRIAGTIPNTPENLWRWLENPQRLKPGTLMPRTPLSAQELDDLVAYLESLR